MSDGANQAEYPQHSNQLPGCGFPDCQTGRDFLVAHRAVVRLYCSIAVEEIVMSRLLYSDLDQKMCY